MFLGDERGLKFSTAAKGSGAHKTCALCLNVVSFKCSWLPDEEGFLVSSAETDYGKFALATDGSI